MPINEKAFEKLCSDDRLREAKEIDKIQWKALIEIYEAAKSEQLVDCRTLFDPNIHCDAARVIAWIDSPERKQAQMAFTEGLERQIAYRFEDAALKRESGGSDCFIVGSNQCITANPNAFYSGTICNNTTKPLRVIIEFGEGATTLLSSMMNTAILNIW